MTGENERTRAPVMLRAPFRHAPRKRRTAPGSERERQRGWSSAATRRSKRCASRLRVSRSVSRFSG